MPVHDWTRVRPGMFHHFHNAWITHLADALNAGLLPSGYYALGEQPAGQIIPDILTLQANEDAPGVRSTWDEMEGGIAVAEHPPKASLTVRAEENVCAPLRRTLTIYHTSSDRIIALLEILSPGNKNSRMAMNSFIEKAVSALQQGIHLLLIDMFPPGSFDPHGIHDEIWRCLDNATYQPPVGKPLTIVAYEGGVTPIGYVEPLAVGDPLIDMPVFLAPGWYINAPLEATYMIAYRGVPERWKRVIEGRK